jgi:hypothetical protein
MHPSGSKQQFKLWLSINKYTALAAPRTDVELAAETQMFGTGTGPRGGAYKGSQSLTS